MLPRSRALIFDHLPSKARRAAATALSMSACRFRYLRERSPVPIWRGNVCRFSIDPLTIDQELYLRGVFVSAG